jgi:hypothetical protein
VIRNKIKVTEVTKKIQERRLQWYGHVMRRDKEYVGKRVRQIQAEGRRTRGRPKKKWEHYVNKDLEEKGLSEEDVNNHLSRKRVRRRRRRRSPDLEVVEEKEKFPSFSFFLLFVLETSPK